MHHTHNQVSRKRKRFHILIMGTMQSAQKMNVVCKTETGFSALNGVVPSVKLQILVWDNQLTEPMIPIMLKTVATFRARVKWDPVHDKSKPPRRVGESHTPHPTRSHSY